MAMIKCRACGMDISDKARKCPYCETVFVEETVVEQGIKCSECGGNIAEGDSICKSCGCPIEEKETVSRETKQELQLPNIKLDARFQKNLMKVGIVVAICVFGLIGYKVYDHQKANKAYNIYIENLRKAQDEMMSGGSDAEDLCDLTVSVWGNAIYETNDMETDEYTCPNGYFVEDFNTALGYFYMDEDTQLTMTCIEDSQENVKDIMKKLQNPPKGLESCYDSVSDLNGKYTKLTNLALNPSGNYSEFSENENEAISEFQVEYDKLETQIPDKK